MTLKPVDFFAFVTNRARRLCQAVAAPKPTCVLIVDDEESVRKLVARILASAGFVPILACGGPDALVKMTALDSCPVLVTDLMMPDMNGDELARRLRQRQPDLKVLFLTGFADRLFAERAVLWEDEAFLEKPFTPKGLVEAVALLLTGHSAVDTVLLATTAPLA